MRAFIVAKHLAFSDSPAAPGGDPSLRQGAPATPLSSPHRVAGPSSLHAVGPDADANAGHQRFAEEVLWPLLHYSLRDVRLDARQDWEAYRRVNEWFARGLLERCRPDDLIVVCDYQLALVPELVRAANRDVKIGFFLQTPFPAPDIFRFLPWRRDILRGLIGADLVGFQGLSSAEHFKMILATEFGLQASTLGLAVDGRVVRVGVYPVGVDTAELERRARAPDVQREAERFRKLGGGKPIVLSVVPGDFVGHASSGTLARIRARYPHLAERAHFVEMVRPCIGQIDPTRGPADWGWSCLYAAADVALITAFGHATSTFEKEYVASRVDDSGVLLVSEASDSARELREALCVNPYDIDTVASAIDRALIMDAVERRTRMRALRARVARNDARRWAQRMIADLLGHPPVSSCYGDGQPLLEQLADLQREDQLDLLFAYDGALVPFAPLPELALPDAGLYRLLGQLATCGRFRVHIVSGRTRNELERWFGELPIALHAEHGYWSRMGSGQAWVAAEVGRQDWKEVVNDIFEDLTERTPGSRVENKTACVAWHYRAADPDLLVTRLQEAYGRIARLGRGDRFELIEGAMVLEARRRGVHGGRVAATVFGRTRGGGVVVASGDAMNEELFAAAPADVVTIHVGTGTTQAAYQVPSPRDLRKALQVLADGRA